MPDHYGKTQNEKKAVELIQIANKAFSTRERTNCKKVWKQLARFILQSGDGPFYGEKQSKGSVEHQETYESSPGIYNRDLASAIHSTLTSPSIRWSKFKFKDESLNDDPQASAWLESVTEAIHSSLNESNFDTQAGVAYLSFTALGTMCLLHDEKYTEKGQFDGFEFKAYHIGEVALLTNAAGLVDTVYRKFTLTPKQAFEMFPDELEYLEMMQKGSPDEEIEFFHCIKPRPAKDVDSKSLIVPPEKRAYASIYVDGMHAKIVKEDGYHELPVYCPRWATKPGEVYGFGPGHVALPDILSVNKIRKETLKGLAQAVNPYKVVKERALVRGDFRPGKLVVVKDMDGFREGNTSTRFEVAFQVIEDYKNSIKSGFYVDKLLLPPRTETGEMTAFEVGQRLEQMQQILGPVVSRLNTEFLTALVMRSFKILYRNNKIAEPPASVLQGRDAPEIDIDILFINSLARSQQLSELRNVQTWMAEVQQMAQINPEVLDDIDFDELLYYTQRVRNIPEQLVKSKKEVQAVRDQRQQQQQQQQLLAAGEQVSNIVKNTGGAGGGQAQ